MLKMKENILVILKPQHRAESTFTNLTSKKDNNRFWFSVVSITQNSTKPLLHLS